MGRLWQTLILSKWKGEFAFIPVENMVYQHQKEYYQAINQSSQVADSAPIVEFMLKRILEAIVELNKTETPEDAPEVTPEVKNLLKSMVGVMSRSELMAKIGLKDEKNFRLRYIQVALEVGVIERTIPEKPNSRLQKYRLTEKGRRFLESWING